jgi:predicted transcriptional regulator
LGSLFGGDAHELVAHLVREDAISAGDLAALRKLLDEKGKSDD